MTSDPLIGQQLDEYRLEKLLGRGGMARVYKATDVRLNRTVAIKVIDAPFRNNKEYGRRFEREAQAIGQLEHPNIVRLYRYGEADNLYYMAMQHIDGIDLYSYMANGRRQGTLFQVEDVLDIVSQICDALDYIHGKGVIHRDIKPSNILLNNRGQAILTDFGLALLDSTRTKGDIFGSPHYIAPEQAISSAGVVPQSDLYAVGVILYEMVTGEVPFNSDNPLAVAMMHASDPPPPPRQIQPDISPALEAVILRALAKDPQARFPNGRALANALRQALLEPHNPAVAHQDRDSTKRPLPPTPAPVAGVQTVGLTATTPPAQTLSSAPKKRRRFPLLFFLLLVLGLLGGSAWMYWTNPQVRLKTNLQLEALGLASLPQPTSTPTVQAEVAALATAVPSPTVSPTATAAELLVAEVPTLPESTIIPSPPSSPTATPSLTPTTIPTQTPTPEPQPENIVRELDNMPMIYIPAATFMMGSTEDDPTAEADELPLHEVTLSGYYIDQYEVNVAQYVRFLNEAVGFYQYENGCLGQACLTTQFEGSDSFVTDFDGQHVAQEGGENKPINYVRWSGAAAYCSWVGGRLPTEAEWEYAAKGDNHNLYPWGNTAPEETLADFGVTDTIRRYIFEIDAVASFPAGVSPFEIYNMAGGVAEWTADVYTTDFYSNSPAENPINSSGTIAELYAVRGGAWYSPAADLRTTARQGLSPATDDKGLGFRCAMNASGSDAPENP